MLPPLPLADPDVPISSICTFPTRFQERVLARWHAEWSVAKRRVPSRGDGPNGAIFGKGTLTPQIRQTCWLLQGPSFISGTVAQRRLDRRCTCHQTQCGNTSPANSPVGRRSWVPTDGELVGPVGVST
jgi:hypothetical protein